MEWSTRLQDGTLLPYLQEQWLLQHLPGSALLQACRARLPSVALRLLQLPDLTSLNAGVRAQASTQES